jgi:AcrR family transcriptional regulator
VFDKETNSEPGDERSQALASALAPRRRVEVLLALAEEVAARGYEAISVDDVVLRAGTTRNAFNAQFSSKEEGFLALQQHASEQSLSRVAAAAGHFESWPEQVAAGIWAFLSYLEAEPAFARACLVEALTATPAVQKRRERDQRAFVSLLQTGRDVWLLSDPAPELLEEAIVGGIFWIIFQRLILGREGGIIEDLCPKVVEFALTPYTGAESARRMAVASRPWERLDERSGAKKLVI